MKSSKLIYHWANMCESGHGTTTIVNIRTKGTYGNRLKSQFHGYKVVSK